MSVNLCEKETEKYNEYFDKEIRDTFSKNSLPSILNSQGSTTGFCNVLNSVMTENEILFSLRCMTITPNKAKP